MMKQKIQEQKCNILLIIKFYIKIHANFQQTRISKQFQRILQQWLEKNIKGGVKILIVQLILILMFKDQMIKRQTKNYLFNDNDQEKLEQSYLPSLLKEDGIQFIKSSTIKYREQYFNQKNISNVIQIKFNMNLSFRKFPNLNLNLVKSSSDSFSNDELFTYKSFMRYYILEIYECKQIKVEQIEQQSDLFYSNEIETDQNIASSNLAPSYNLSSIQLQEEHSEIASESLQALQFVNELNDFDDQNIKIKFEQQLKQEEEKQKAVEQINRKKQKMKQSFEPLIFLKSQVLIEDGPNEIEEDELSQKLNIQSNIQSGEYNIVSPRDQSKQLLGGEISLQNKSNLNQSFQPQIIIASKKNEILEKKKEKAQKISISQSDHQESKFSSLSHQSQNTGQDLIIQLYEGKGISPKSLFYLKTATYLYGLSLLIGIIIMIVVNDIQNSQLLSKTDILTTPFSINELYVEGLLSAIQLKIDKNQTSIFEYHINSSYEQLLMIFLTKMKQIVDISSSLQQKFNSSNLSIKQFQQNKSYTQTMSFLSFIQNTLNNLNQVKELQLADNILTLESNFPNFTNMAFYLFNEFADSLEKDQSVLFFNVIIVSFSILALYGLLFFLMFLLARQISLYQQKILMLISKISQAENELMIQKSKVILDMLQNSPEIFKINAFYQGTSIKKQSKSDHHKFQTKLQSQQVSVIWHIVCLLLVTLVSIFFFIIVLILISQNNVSLQQSIEQYSHSAAEISRFSNLVLSSEILCFRTFNEYNEIFQYSDVPKGYWISQFIENLSLSGSYILILLNINESNDIRNSEFDRILKGDLCSQLPDEVGTILKEQCSNELNRNYLKRGLVIGLQDMVRMLLNYQEVLKKDELSQSDKEYLRQFYQNNDHQSLLVKYSGILNYNLSRKIIIRLFQGKILYLLQDQNRVIIQNQQTQMNLYFYIAGSCVLLIQIVSLMLYYQHIHHQLFLLKFGLTFISSDKLNDQNTLHQLKKLQSA